MHFSVERRLKSFDRCLSDFNGASQNKECRDLICNKVYLKDVQQQYQRQQQLQQQ